MDSLRLLRLAAAAGIVALLPACHLLGIGGSAAETESNNSIAKAEDPPAEKAERPRRESGDEPTRNDSRGEEGRTERASTGQDWIVGRWGDPGCQTILDIQGDGTFLINGNQGNWRLDGDTLTMGGSNGEQVYTVIRDGGAFSIEDGEGNLQQLVRC